MFLGKSVNIASILLIEVRISCTFFGFWFLIKALNLEFTLSVDLEIFLEKVFEFNIGYQNEQESKVYHKILGGRNSSHPNL